MERLLEILALLESPDDLSDEQIGDLGRELLTIFDEIRAEDADGDDAVETQMAALNDTADAIDNLGALASQRIEVAEAAAAAEATAAAEHQATLDALDARVHGTEASTGDGDEPEGEGEGDEPVTPAEGDEGEGEVEGEPAGQLEPVAAAATPAGPSRVAALGAVKPPKKYAATPRRTDRRAVAMLIPGSNEHYTDRAAVDRALQEMWSGQEGTGFSGRSKVATFRAAYEADRVLTSYSGVADVQEYVDAIRDAALAQDGGAELLSLTADGGLCAPVNVWYGLETVAQASRPLRASLPNFNADRGGIRFMTPTLLSAIGAGSGGAGGQAVGVVTAAQDAATGQTKVYQTVPCGTAKEVDVDAVYRYLEFGNFIARTNPERVSQFTDLSIAAYARFSEQRLFNTMVANSTAVSAAQSIGALRDFLSQVGKAATNYRIRHRMDQGTRLQVVLPIYVATQLQDDIAKALNSELEMLSVTMQQIEAMINLRGVDVTWTIDTWTNNVTAGGQINAYPSSFTWLLFHKGAHMYIDNGALEVGTFRDTTLVGKNTFRTFSEEFWNVAMIGLESLAITTSLCANGASAGSVAPKCGS